MGLQLQFRHDCQNLGCPNTACNLCKLCQRRRCPTNFASKYLAPCDVVEAKCGAQIYVVVIDDASGQLVQQGLEELAIMISITDARKYDAEVNADVPPETALDHCELLENKQGQPLLAHGRSGSYTDSKRVLVPMIHGQALLPDLKITDSSEALLTGRAPPFRLTVRAVHRSGEPFEGVASALSDPFVVATARVKGAAKLEIPHVDDHVSKIDCVGLQTQKKLEDIKAAAIAAGVPDLNLPINSVVKVGQFRDLVEAAERNKALRETLKQVLRLTKGWDVAREHVRKAVETDVQLRVYHPDGRTEVGLVFKCGSFNVIDINRPIGLMRRKQNPHQANQELVDVIWLPVDTASFPDAVKRMLPQASADWRKDGHQGWALLPLTTSHMPPYSEGGKPASQTSSFTFTIRSAPAAPAPSAGGPAPSGTHGPSPQQAGGPGGMPGQVPPMMAGSGSAGMNGFVPPPGAGSGGLPMGLNLPGMGLPGVPNQLQGQQAQQAQQLPGGAAYMQDPQLALRMQQQQQQQQHGMGGMPNAMAVPGMGMYGSGQQPPMSAAMQQQHAAPSQQQQQQQQQFGGLGGMGLPPTLAGLDPGMLQSLMQIPAFDMFSGGGGGLPAGPPRGGAPPQPTAPPLAPRQQQQQQGVGGALPPELANLLKEDSMSPFEDPSFQQLMSMVAANAPPGSGPGGGRGAAPRSGGREKAAKRKADTSLETWMDMNKTLDLDSLPPQGPLESLFTSMLPGGGDLGNSGGPAPPPVGFFPAMPSMKAGGDKDKEDADRGPKSPRAEAAASDGAAGGAAGAAGAACERGLDRLASVKSEAASQRAQRQHAVPDVSMGNAEPMEVQQPATSTARGSSGDDSSAALQAGAAAAPPVLLPAAQPLVKTVTLEDMQTMFARAMRQEISFAELEVYLKRYNLLPSGAKAGAAGAAGAAMAAAMAGPFAGGGGGGAAPHPFSLRDPSGGLEDMQTIEQALPSSSEFQKSGSG